MKGLTKEVTTVGRRKSKDIHRRLVEEFREADRKYGEDYGEVPDFDFSFLDDPDSGTVDRERGSAKAYRKGSGFRRFMVAAVCVMILLLSANLLLIMTDSTDIYGDRGILHRIKTGVAGLFTDEDAADPDGIRESMSITDMKDIGSAKKFLPQLYVPGYIPDGYELERLVIDEYYSGDVMGEYDFHDKKGRDIMIAFEYMTGDVSHTSASQGELMELPDRKIYITESSARDELCADVITEDSHLIVTGVPDQRTEIIKLAKALEK